jgi:hypothetical protein
VADRRRRSSAPEKKRRGLAAHCRASRLAFVVGEGVVEAGELIRHGGEAMRWRWLRNRAMPDDNGARRARAREREEVRGNGEALGFGWECVDHYPRPDAGGCPTGGHLWRACARRRHGDGGGRRPIAGLGWGAVVLEPKCTVKHFHFLSFFCLFLFNLSLFCKLFGHWNTWFNNYNTILPTTRNWFG